MLLLLMTTQLLRQRRAALDGEYRNERPSASSGAGSIAIAWSGIGFLSA